MSAISFEDFDPNNLTGKDALWGVYAGDAFKAYTKRAHALSRFSGWSKAKIYYYNPQAREWETIGVKDAGPKNYTCDICGGDTRSGSNRYGNFGKFVWDRKGGKLADPLTLFYACSDCRNAKGL